MNIIRVTFRSALKSCNEEATMALSLSVKAQSCKGSFTVSVVIGAGEGQETLKTAFWDFWVASLLLLFGTLIRLFCSPRVFGCVVPQKGTLSVYFFCRNGTRAWSSCGWDHNILLKLCGGGGGLKWTLWTWYSCSNFCFVNSLNGCFKKSAKLPISLRRWTRG